jgi:hypothetical protein
MLSNGKASFINCKFLNAIPLQQFEPNDIKLSTLFFFYYIIIF